jgi:hypothetical protein
MSSVFEGIVNPTSNSFLDLNEQTRSCQKLLASVVHLSIKDACTRPPTEKKGKSLGDIHTDAFTALRFLFGEGVAGLNEYATWLDFDAGQFRKKLLEMMRDDTAKFVFSIGPEDRRAFRYNYKTWLTIKDIKLEELDEDTDD